MSSSMAEILVENGIKKQRQNCRIEAGRSKGRARTRPNYKNWPVKMKFEDDKPTDKEDTKKSRCYRRRRWSWRRWGQP